MEKYVTSIKELAVQAMTNLPKIKKSAEKGEPKACFQMGMLYLLGIETPIDFTKAAQYFGDQSLTNDPETFRLLGFIAEYNGEYSSAFQNYAKASSNNYQQSYIDNVIKERIFLQDFLKKLDLPIVLNQEVSAILSDYSKGGKSKVNASIMLATLCDDQLSSVQVAQCFYEAGDYFSANRWLQKGHVGTDNPLTASINEKLTESIESLKRSISFEVVELNGESLITNTDSALALEEVKKKCAWAATVCRKDWNDKITKKIYDIKIKAEEEERTRKALLQKQAEEDKLKNKKKARRMMDIILVIIYLVFLIRNGISMGYDSENTFQIDMAIMSFFFVLLLTILPFFLIRWVLRKFIK